jgi:hypothetical protein
MFMVIGAAAMTLIKAHMPMASSSANQAGLTMNLRNALSQIELDAVNAGTGYYPGTNVADWPVGFTVVNQDETVACNSGGVNDTFGPNCFDTLNIIAGDPTFVPAHPSAVSIDLETTGTADITPTPPTTAAALAGTLKVGDELLWLSVGNPPHVTTTVLSQPPVVNALAGTVTLTFNKTTSVATTMGPPPQPAVIHGINATDPYLIASTPPQADNTAGNSMALGSTFANTDWVIRIIPVTYQVDLTTPTNPKLVRTQGTNKDVVAEQIIGFRVGASTRSNTTTSNTYNFAAQNEWPSQGCVSNCGYNNAWEQVRAVRISVIGRTPPNSDLATNYHNTFDGGPYKIQGLSVTINPRNLSMTDQ